MQGAKGGDKGLMWTLGRTAALLALILLRFAAVQAQEATAPAEESGAEEAAPSDADFVVYLQQAVTRDQQRLARLNEEAGRLAELFDSVSELARTRFAPE